MSSERLNLNNRRLAWLVGIAFLLINLILWLAMWLAGHGHLLSILSSKVSSEIVTALAPIWDFINAPINYFFLPYLSPYMPSHGGIESQIAVSIYVVLCSIQVFIIGFLIGKFIKKLN